MPWAAIEEDTSLRMGHHLMQCFSEIRCIVHDATFGGATGSTHLAALLVEVEAALERKKGSFQKGGHNASYEALLQVVAMLGGTAGIQEASCCLPGHHISLQRREDLQVHVEARIRQSHDFGGWAKAEGEVFQSIEMCKHTDSARAAAADNNISCIGKTEFCEILEDGLRDVLSSEVKNRVAHLDRIRYFTREITTVTVPEIDVVPVVHQGVLIL
mmetsp:Transcript_9782/g.23478  ORF Transcript_9782/g.23478 Transcript_9782/m.23478 type:complete len:215 (+) Transcript_9782:238-882(+)